MVVICEEIGFGKLFSLPVIINGADFLESVVNFVRMDFVIRLPGPRLSLLQSRGCDADVRESPGGGNRRQLE